MRKIYKYLNNYETNKTNLVLSYKDNPYSYNREYSHFIEEIIRLDITPIFNQTKSLRIEHQIFYILDLFLLAIRDFI